MKTKVQNMTGNSGREIANQFEIFTDEGKYFQSYSTVIAFKPFSYAPEKPVSDRLPHEKIMLDAAAWDYSRTTGKYRNMFLRETKAETQKKIDSGEYLLVDLN